eukprot:63074-Prymnesium_polylepis.1
MPRCSAWSGAPARPEQRPEQRQGGAWGSTDESASWGVERVFGGIVLLNFYHRKNQAEMEMADEDTVAPRLADADLEERFAELQDVLKTKDEAIAKAESLSNAKPGDEVYDDILEDVSGSSDVDDKVQAVIDQLVRARRLFRFSQLLRLTLFPPHRARRLRIGTSTSTISTNVSLSSLT